MSRATPWAPNPNAIAAPSAIAPNTIRNVGAVSCTAIPSCVRAYDEDEPEDQPAENAGRRLAGVRPIKESLYAGALHPTIEAYPLQDATDHGLEYLGHDVADDQDDVRANQLR